MTDVADLIRTARLPERSVSLCLRGDLVAEHEELSARLAAARRRAATSLAGNPEAQQLSEDIQALEARMTESMLTVRLRALPRREWAKLVAEHPPRHDDAGLVLPGDDAGINADTFMAAVLHRCIVDPHIDPQDWDELVDNSLTDAQYSQLTEAVWALNRRTVDVPFSPAASTILRASAPE